MFSNSPRLIAAVHVLHRLLTPRHPPYTLSSLTILDQVQVKVRNKFAINLSQLTVLSILYHIYDMHYSVLKDLILEA